MKRFIMKRQLLRLADAISAGSRKRPQCVGALFRVARIISFRRGLQTRERYALRASCALGAAYEGAFGRPPMTTDSSGSPRVDGGDSMMLLRLRRQFPVLQVSVCQEATPRRARVDSWIIDLNDGKRWRRGRIARWLRRQARAL